MKSKTIPFMVFLLSAFFAFAETNDDTIKVYKVLLNGDVSRYVFEDYCNIVVVPDTADFLTTTTSRIGDKNLYGLKTKIGKDHLTISVGPGFPQLELHLSNRGSCKIETNDWSSVTYQLVEQLASLDVSANDYSEVTIRQIGNGDTLRVRRMKVKADDYSKVRIESPCVADRMDFVASDYAIVNAGYCKCTTMNYTISDFAKVDVRKPNASVTNTNYTSVDEETKTSSTDKESESKYYWDDFSLNFGWAFTNWGSQPYNGLSKMNGAYSLGTTFSSYQLEGIYYPWCVSHWRFGIGLGYESDVYHFTTPYVSVVPNAQQAFSYTFEGSDRQDANWTSRLVTRYITLPITLRWDPVGDFYVGLTVIPGINYSSDNTGLKHKGEFLYNGQIRDRQPVSNVMNPFKVDARLTLTYSHFSVFAQIAALPVFNEMDRKVYPIKVGFMINISDD